MTTGPAASSTDRTSAWRRSSFTTNYDCVELAWRRSTRSGSAGGNCVELARASADALLVRDSKNARGPQLSLPGEALTGLAGYAARGRGRDRA